MAAIGDGQVISKDRMRDSELRTVLMKIMAEQNKEKFMEYDCKTDLAVLSEIENGKFKDIVRVQGYYTNNNLNVSRVAEEDREVYRKAIERCLKRPTSRILEIRWLDDDGNKIWHRVFIASIADENRQVVKLAARFISIQKEKEAQDILRTKAESDSLSGVYNHKTYEKLCGKMLEKYKDGILFLMIDIDNFKRINDTYGHHMGDCVVREVGHILSTSVKDRGIAGRLGGDEFSVCLFNVWDKEEVTKVAMRIKDAMRKEIEGIYITVSIGATYTNGRQMTFKDLYFEADEAVYYAKDHGKNQIIFSDDMAENMAAMLKEVEVERSSATEDEVELDDNINYCAIISPVNHKILYMNTAARRTLGITLEEAKQMSCMELFKGSENPCKACELHANHVDIIEGVESCGLAKYIPNGKFIVQSQYTIWEGKAARIAEFIDVNDSAHVRSSFETQIEAQNTLDKCWAILTDPKLHALNYTKVLAILSEYYDGDCSAIVTKNGEHYEKVYEHHKESACNVVDGIYMSLEKGYFEACEVLLDEAGYMRPKHIHRVMQDHPDVARMVQEAFVHNTIGVSLTRQGEMAGVLMVINPRRNLGNYSIMKRIGAFFTTDLLRKHLVEELQYKENHDLLTHLWKREHYMPFLDAFRNHIKKNYGVLLVDIFHLNEINKQFGYDNGNKRIMELAEVHKNVFDGFPMFRYDDDQILTICNNVDKESFDKLVRYAKELFAELDFEVSCGYAWTQSNDIADVVRDAERFMEKDRMRLITENDFSAKNTRRVEKDVKKETEAGNFRMFLQPKVNVTTGETVGAEALVRLYDEEKGYISPAYFIPILEEYNAIHLIDMFMLRRAFEYQARALTEGRKMVPISVNFSKNTIMYKNLIEYIKHLSDEFQLPNGSIIIEITETVSNMDHIEVQKIATSLRHMGFSISMDDFGTQYSNMSVLTQFDFDTVKIDRSMILDLEENSKNKTLLKHILSMLEDLGLETVMEGVETAEQVEILKELGCNVIQGFYYGRPEPEEKFYELFMK